MFLVAKFILVNVLGFWLSVNCVRETGANFWVKIPGVSFECLQGYYRFFIHVENVVHDVVYE